jgi:hypothetical protein
MKRSIIAIVAAVLLIGGVLLFGNRHASAPDKTAENQPAQTSDAPVLPPVTASDFGGLSLVNADATKFVYQNKDQVTSVGSQVNSSQYQGVLYKPTDTSFRVLYGKLADKAPGKLVLTDAFELVVVGQANGSRDVSLHKADPNTIDLDTTKIVRWTNVPDYDQIAKAIAQYKQQN